MKEAAFLCTCFTKAGEEFTKKGRSLSVGHWEFRNGYMKFDYHDHGTADGDKTLNQQRIARSCSPADDKSSY